jgi:Mor family transcriptional regulator
MSDEKELGLTFEDLPEVYQSVADIVGMENTMKLARTFGGAALYFPRIQCVLREKRDQAILREFNGANHRELARRHGLSEQRIRMILREHGRRGTAHTARATGKS